MATKTKSDIKLKPLGDRILIKRVEAEEKTKGGIVLPDTAKEKPREGIVLAIGEGRALENGSRVPFTVKVDDRVLFSSYAGTEVKWDGEEFLVLSEDDIIGVFA
ncbi:MAG: co-chaperone GroES [Planctomycetes bacterium]|nr:co-chaperone GroES [Planctomycetota bacterium]